MADELSPSSIFAGYRVESLVGRGGMGAVYRAVRLEDDARVALKVLLSSHARNPRFLARFEREARLASELDHPHVVRVHEAGTADGVPFLAMELVDGVELDAVIAERGGLHPAAAARIVAQVASGLDAAHELGLVHRDVKPQNVLLERPNASRAYLADFGLSKHVESTSGITGTGQWVGTVDYAAPEQIQAEPTDARTDVYSLGCVLFKALTGEVPYPRDRDVDAMVAHLGGAPPAVTEAVPGAPAELDEVIRRSMALRPEDRQQSAGELGEAARAAAEPAGPEPADAIPLHVPAAVDSDAPTAG